MRTLIISGIRLAVVAALAVVLTQPVLKAQAPGTVVVANIPFAFQIGSNHYAAGTYTLSLEPDHLLAIRGTSGAGMMQVMWDSTYRPSANSRIVFRHYGDHYFLSQLRISGHAEFLRAPQSKAERTARLEEEASNRNSNRNEGSNVEVALLAPSR